MKKVFLLLVSFLCVIYLAGCEKYPNEPWSISQEMFAEYFMKYVDYAIETVETFELDYEKEINLFNSDGKQEGVGAPRYVLKFYFNDGFEMEFKFFQSQRFYVNLSHELLFFEGVQSINQNYFEIIYKICQFSVYDLHGDENTFPNLIEETHMNYETGILSNWYTWYHSSLGRCGYDVRITQIKKDEFSVYIFFEAFLSDKNLI